MRFPTFFIMDHQEVKGVCLVPFTDAVWFNIIPIRFSDVDIDSEVIGFLKFTET